MDLPPKLLLRARKPQEMFFGESVAGFHQIVFFCEILPVTGLFLVTGEVSNAGTGNAGGTPTQCETSFFSSRLGPSHGESTAESVEVL